MCIFYYSYIIYCIYCVSLTSADFKVCTMFKLGVVFAGVQATGAQGVNAAGKSKSFPLSQSDRRGIRMMCSDVTMTSDVTTRPTSVRYISDVITTSDITTTC